MDCGTGDWYSTESTAARMFSRCSTRVSCAAHWAQKSGEDVRGVKEPELAPLSVLRWSSGVRKVKAGGGVGRRVAKEEVERGDKEDFGGKGDLVEGDGEGDDGLDMDLGRSLDNDSFLFNKFACRCSGDSSAGVGCGTGSSASGEVRRFVRRWNRRSLRTSSSEGRGRA